MGNFVLILFAWVALIIAIPSMKNRFLFFYWLAAVLFWIGITAYAIDQLLLR